MTKSRLRVVVSHDPGGTAASGLSRWLARVAPVRARGVVNVAVTSDATVRALNRRYRHQDAATDVLSFAYLPETRRRFTNSSHSRATTPPSQVLGDIVIARGVARRQARAAGHDERTELKVLALHGLLHLLGYDHHQDDGVMARMERRLRRKGGLREGLIERAQP